MSPFALLLLPMLVTSAPSAGPALRAPTAATPRADLHARMDGVLARVPAQRGERLNAHILDEVAHLARQRGLHYGWVRGEDTDGVSRPLMWGAAALAVPDPGGSVHCSGVTFEVWLRALTRVVGPDSLDADAAGIDSSTLLSLKESWYNRDGSERGPVAALLDAGLGEPITSLEALQPGDLVQFWRNNGNGHSAVFMGHTHTRSGAIRGMVFWSAQASSGGVGSRYVSVGPSDAQITPGRLYGVRAVAPAGGSASGVSPGQ
jgi:hypothetical protein